MSGDAGYTNAIVNGNIILIFTQQEIGRLTLFIDRTVERAPLPFHFPSTGTMKAEV